MFLKKITKLLETFFGMYMEKIKSVEQLNEPEQDDINIKGVDKNGCKLVYLSNLGQIQLPCMF